MGESFHNQDRSRLGERLFDVVPWDEAVGALLEHSVKVARERVLEGGALGSDDGLAGIAKTRLRLWMLRWMPCQMSVLSYYTPFS